MFSNIRHAIQKNDDDNSIRHLCRSLISKEINDENNLHLIDAACVKLLENKKNKKNCVYLIFNGFISYSARTEQFEFFDMIKNIFQRYENACWEDYREILKYEETNWEAYLLDEMPKMLKKVVITKAFLFDILNDYYDGDIVAITPIFNLVKQYLNQVDRSPYFNKRFDKIKKSRFPSHANKFLSNNSNQNINYFRSTTLPPIFLSSNNLFNDNQGIGTDNSFLNVEVENSSKLKEKPVTSSMIRSSYSELRLVHPNPDFHLNDELSRPLEISSGLLTVKKDISLQNHVESNKNDWIVPVIKVAKPTLQVQEDGFVTKNSAYQSLGNGYVPSASVRSFLVEESDVAFQPQPQPQIPVSKVNNFSAFTTLNLSNCNKESDELKKVIGGLNHTILEHLNLSGNKLDDDAITELAVFIRNTTLLQSLDISKASGGYYLVTRVGFSALGNALKVNRSLKFLNLQSTYMADDRAAALSVGFCADQKFEGLNFNKNEIGDVGVQHLMQSISSLSFLKYLYFSENKITDIGMKPIIEFVKENKSLMVLQMACNKYSATSASEMKQALVDNDMLVNISCDRIEEYLDNYYIPNHVILQIGAQSNQFVDFNHQLYSQCKDAIKVGDAKKVESSLKKGVCLYYPIYISYYAPNFKGCVEEGNTLLHLAIIQRQPEIAKLILNTMKEKCLPLTFKNDNNKTIEDLINEALPVSSSADNAKKWQELLGLINTPFVRLPAISAGDRLLSFFGLKKQVSAVKNECDPPFVTRSDFTTENEIGKGAFGVVYKGQFNNQTVAIKMLKVANDFLSEANVEDFKREANIHAGLQCEFIAKVLAICFEANNYALMMEFYPNGSLKSLLNIKSGAELSWKLRYQLSLQISIALNYVHSKKIIHRDLKTDNILISNTSTAKLIDFGLAVVKDSAACTSDFLEGTWGWYGPELEFEKPRYYDEHSDVYSLGVVLWSIATRCEVFDGAKKDDLQKKLRRNREGEREKIPKEAPGYYRTIIDMCWMERRKDRYLTENVIEKLKSYTYSH